MMSAEKRSECNDLGYMTQFFAIVLPKFNSSFTRASHIGRIR